MRICLGLGLCFASSLPLPAGTLYDPAPPSWRGQSNTTYQAWGFGDDSSSSVAPTASINPYGTPVANITVGAFGSGYLTTLPGLGNQINFWDLGGAGGSIALLIPHPAGLSSTISLQVTYFQSITQPPTLSITNTFAGATLQSSANTTVETVPAFGSWITSSSTWLLTPAADVTDYYWIVSGGNGSVVESVVVDTKTIVPEPTTLSLAVVGLAWLGLRRRR